MRVSPLMAGSYGGFVVYCTVSSSSSRAIDRNLLIPITALLLPLGSSYFYFFFLAKFLFSRCVAINIKRFIEFKAFSIPRDVYTLSTSDSTGFSHTTSKKQVKIQPEGI